MSYEYNSAEPVKVSLSSLTKQQQFQPASGWRRRRRRGWRGWLLGRAGPDVGGRGSA